jgi:hypothetical protein
MVQITRIDMSNYMRETIMIYIIEKFTTKREYIHILNDKDALYKYFESFGKYMHWGVEYFADTCTNEVYEQADVATMSKDQLIKAIAKKIMIYDNVYSYHLKIYTAAKHLYGDHERINMERDIMETIMIHILKNGITDQNRDSLLYNKLALKEYLYGDINCVYMGEWNWKDIMETFMIHILKNSAIDQYQDFLLNNKLALNAYFYACKLKIYLNIVKFVSDCADIIYNQVNVLTMTKEQFIKVIAKEISIANGILDEINAPIYKAAIHLMEHVQVDQQCVAQRSEL